ncbi:MAG: homoserine O-acetyltransferase [Nitriliruptoraceae bacterium]|nr:homoserine O-acetyltransferase [Nitriliruptoraceae bacterium]
MPATEPVPGRHPASGAWHVDDPVGDRRFLDVGTVPLELDGELPEVRLAYETWGELDPDGGNAVLVLHALTGDSHVIGPVGPGHPTPGWWDTVIGPGQAIDTDRWFVVCPNVLGGCQGSTGPASIAPDGRPWGARFPRLTVRDQVTAEFALADHLGIDAWAGVVGGSMGAMRVLEWAIMAPDRVRAIAPLAVSATATADQIAVQSIQIAAIRRDPAFRGGDYLQDWFDDPEHAEGPTDGLELARQLAHLTYRSAEELGLRFGRRAQADEDPLRDGRFAVQSYLEYHGGKLARRFDAASYVTLTEVMNTHDVGRDRGGVGAALRRIQAEVLIAGVDSDRLYPLTEQHSLAHLLGVPSQRAHVIRSPHGHDGFLIERDQVGRLLGELLDRVS